MKPSPFKALAAAALTLTLTGAIAAVAATPPPQELLPADTLAMLTAPDWTKLGAAGQKSATTRFLEDPAMRPFVEKFKAAWNKNILEPIERDLGIRFSDYSDIVTGQITAAVVQNGWNGGPGREPAVLFILDSGDNQRKLARALADVQSKWTDSGKQLKTRDVRGVQFTEYELKGADLEAAVKRIFPLLDDGAPAGQDAPNVKVHVAQSESLLLIGNDPQAFEKLLVRQSGGSVPSLARLPAYERDHNALFSNAGIYGWMHLRKFIDVAMEQARAAGQAAPANPLMPVPAPDKLMEALGIAGLKTAAFHIAQKDDGEIAGAFLGIPEQERKGLFKLLMASPKDSSPPAFVPDDVASFSRWRLDAKKSWNDFEALLNSLSPQFGATLNFILAPVGKDKDPNFDIRQAFFGNLGDDFISLAKAPRSAELEEIAQPPSLGLISSPNPAQLANALKMLASLSPLGGGAVEEREFLGRTIYKLGLPSQPDGKGGFKEMGIHFAATGNFVAVSIDAPMLESYLRDSSVSRPLKALPGLAQAAERVGGMNTGFFYYDNPTETLKMIFETFRKNPDAFEDIISSQFTGMPGIELWNAEKRREWIDFSLLPPFDQVAKYFGYSVFSVRGTPAGIRFDGFTPTPPQLR